ncbi:unnamed protein product [Ambrosiozyma monospora]|uniref:Unnamed protein product n=1 Tax=Ambrosiozyma monospora TaxID=43982 RepID=A0ACB5TEL4_AMBMO|nr:unnamed protein product [Ambrosiozyma monospora]
MKNSFNFFVYAKIFFPSEFIQFACKGKDPSAFALCTSTPNTNHQHQLTKVYSMRSDDNKARRKRQKVDLTGLDIGYSSSSSSSEESEDETPKPTENQHEEDKKSSLAQPKTTVQDQITPEDETQITEPGGNVEQHEPESDISNGTLNQN